MNDDAIKRVNKCKDFEFNEIDVLNENKRYKPRKEKNYRQMRWLDE
jgi:hypothetical protein